VPWTTVQWDSQAVAIANCSLCTCMLTVQHGNTSGVLSCGHWPDTDRFVLESGTFLGQGRLSSNVVDSLLTRGPLLAPCLPWTSPTPCSSYFLKHMHDKRTPQAQCQFTPRVYAAGTGFLLTCSCGCGFSTYPQHGCGFLRGSRNPTRTPTPYTRGKNPRGLPVPVHITNINISNSGAGQEEADARYGEPCQS
jgi:hypothetical protein